IPDILARIGRRRLRHKQAAACLHRQYHRSVGAKSLLSSGIASAVLVLACSTFEEDAARSSGATAGARAIGCGAGGTCTGTSLCCIEGDNGPFRCSDSASCSQHGFYRVACHDSADCPDNTVCCLTLDGGFKGKGNSCAVTCETDATHIRLCD